jgi:transmembrane sensor
MKDESHHDVSPPEIARAAAAWVLRIDRGLTPAEQDTFSEWLAADPRHGEQLARHRRHWQRLDTLAHWRPEHGANPNPDLLAPPARTRLLRFALPAAFLAAAAAVALLAVRTDREPARVASSATAAAVSSRTLSDGTMVELNRDAELAVEFSASKRRVRLARGEAHFAVTKDAARPFVVEAGGVSVRAVGTAFNVRLGPATLEVLVTEGKVELVPPGPATSTDSATPPAGTLLAARQRAVVSLTPAAPPAPRVDLLTAGEIDRVLAWQHRVVDFTATPLREVAAQFNRRNVIQLVIADPELAAVKISATFRTDNVDGFVHLLEAGFGAAAERRGADEIVLRRAGN